VKLSQEILSFVPSASSGYSGIFFKFGTLVEQMEKPHYLAGIFLIMNMVLLNTADVFMTYFAVATGAEEQNPFVVAVGLEWLIPFKIIGMGLAVYVWSILRQENHKQADAMWAGMLVIYSALMMFNGLQFMLGYATGVFP
jgi:uncharacterized protein (DUF486 family)